MSVKTLPLIHTNIYAISRSGGTILSIFLQHCVSKTSSLRHAYHEGEFTSDRIQKQLDSKNTASVILKRHPYAIYCSMAHVTLGPRNKESGECVININDHQHNRILKDLRREFDPFIEVLKNFEDIIPVLKYEDFYNNYNHVVGFLSENFDISVDECLFDEFISKYSIEQCVSRREDKNDTINNRFIVNHISSGRGNNLANLKLIPVGMRDKFQEDLQPYVDAFGYLPYSFESIKFDNKVTY